MTWQESTPSRSIWAAVRNGRAVDDFNAERKTPSESAPYDTSLDCSRGIGRFEVEFSAATNTINDRRDMAPTVERSRGPIRATHLDAR